MSIFRVVRDPNNHSKIMYKDTLRVINVHPTFEGITSKGEINKDEFKKLADALEPGNDGFIIQ